MGDLPTATLFSSTGAKLRTFPLGTSYFWLRVVAESPQGSLGSEAFFILGFTTSSAFSSAFSSALGASSLGSSVLGFDAFFLAGFSGAFSGSAFTSGAGASAGVSGVGVSFSSVTAGVGFFALGFLGALGFSSLTSSTSGFSVLVMPRSALCSPKVSSSKSFASSPLTGASPTLTLFSSTASKLRTFPLATSYF